MFGNADIIRVLLKAATFEEAQTKLKTKLLLDLEAAHQQLVVNGDRSRTRTDVEAMINEFRNM